ncbi:hypothetical protein GCM10023116_13090 [Kistimonas scapharcae]|uniref:Terminase n=1 Tax=Kistimonas scapharcae TaxID=1036133 RepID=A0ABP8UYW9_9GAMM
MTTPAMAFRQRMLEQKQAEQQRQRVAALEETAIEVAASDYSAFQRLQASLEKDMKRLSSFPSGTPRNTVKNDELLPVYLPVVQEYIDQGELYTNPVLVMVMIWLFDCGRVTEALAIAGVAVEQKQPMPEWYKRNLPTFVADTVFEWADGEAARGNPVEPYFSEVFQRLTDEQWPVPDVTRMRFHKLAGNLTRDKGEHEQALEYFLMAQQLDPKRSQVKTVIKELQKHLQQTETKASPDRGQTAP